MLEQSGMVVNYFKCSSIERLDFLITTQKCRFGLILHSLTAVQSIGSSD
jgi:hypothetical protein